MMNGQESCFTLVLYQHRDLGYVFRGALLPLARQGSSWSDISLLGPDSPGLAALGPEAKDIVSLSEDCSEWSLCKRFSKNKTPVTFIRELEDKNYRQFVRPFLDRQLNKAITLALAAGIPMHIRDKGLSDNHLISLHHAPNPGEAILHFERMAEALRYRIEVYHDEEQIPLRDNHLHLLAYAPCWMAFRGKLFRMQADFEGIRLKPFLEKEAILVPRDKEKQYMKTFVLKNVRNGEIRAVGFDIIERKLSPELELSLEFDWQGNAVFILWFRYGEKCIMAGKRQNSFVDLHYPDDHIVFSSIRRDAGRESLLIKGLLEMGLKRINENTAGLPPLEAGRGVSMHRMVEWINAHAAGLAGEGIRVVQAGTGNAYFTGQIGLDVQLNEGLDWFDLYGKVRFGEIEFPFIQLWPYILNKEKEFPLPDGQIAVIPGEWFTRYTDLFSLGELQGERIRVKAHHFLLLQDAGEGSRGGHMATREAFQRNRELPVEVPPGLKASLRPYQAEGLQWLQFQNRMRFGSCLADDMGLGKTVQTLALLLGAQSDGKTSLIVMPTSLIHNWVNEIKLFTPGLRYLVHTGMNRHDNAQVFRAFDLVLTTYGTLRNDIGHLATFPFYYLVLDESQVIKNPAAQVSRAVFSLKGQHRLALTGTPVENSLTDLWSQMHFLNPGLLGTLSWFQKQLGPLADTSDGIKGQEKVMKMVAPFILRRRKAAVEPDLPPLTESTIFSEMTDEQRVIYDMEKSAARNFLLEKAKGETRAVSMHVLKALIRLRQLANYPGLIDPQFIGSSGKVEDVLSNLEVLQEENHKVLVYSSFVRLLLHFSKEFEQRNWHHTILSGQTRKREEVVRDFKTDKGKNIFLISLKAGGTGLNLAEASYVFLLDPWWNPAAGQQAIHRAHRIGQKHKVIAYNYITKGSVEEKILELQQQKRALASAMMPTRDPLKDLSLEEAAWLFE